MPEMLSTSFAYLRWKFTVSLGDSFWSSYVFYGLKNWASVYFMAFVGSHDKTVGMQLDSCFFLRHCLGGQGSELFYTSFLQTFDMKSWNTG